MRILKRVLRFPGAVFGLVEYWLGVPFYPDAKEQYCTNQAPFRTPRV